jgi:hypothetical protein
MAVEILEIHRFNAEGWPLCPACGNDSLLMDLEGMARTLTELHSLLEADFVCEICAWSGKGPDAP